MLGLQRREIATLAAAFIIGFGLATAVRAGWIDWSWPGWTVVGSLATLMAAVVAVVAIYYASQSLRAARDTVKPLEDMAAKLTATVNTLKNVEAGQDATAGTMKANLELAQQIRAESPG